MLYKMESLKAGPKLISTKDNARLSALLLLTGDGATVSVLPIGHTQKAWVGFLVPSNNITGAPAWL